MPQQTSAGGGLKLLGVALIILGGVIYVASGGVDENPSAFLAIPFIARVGTKRALLTSLGF